jgi:phosphoribosyl-AMP cyclohydrolase / phosphoribosyl-ATP pyrophosphohydrolase
MKIAISEIKFDERGLAPAIVQDANTLEVLMLAYVNARSLQRTLETNETWFWSRSRASLWHKGETSGNKQRVVDVSMDCDYDAIRILVVPEGPACHTGAQSCFHNELQDAPASKQNAPPELGATLAGLYKLIESRKREKPEGSYTTYLFAEGLDKILKKIGEEATETIIAAKNEDPDALVREVSDLLYHVVVLLVERGLSLNQLSGELSSRRKRGNDDQQLRT